LVSTGGKTLQEGPNFNQHYVSLPLSSDRALEEGSPLVYPDDVALGVAYIPPEAAIARELRRDGAAWVIWTDVFSGKRAFMSPELECIGAPEPLRWRLEELRRATGRRLLGGLPDVIAGFADGRLLFREAKHISKRYKDKWGPKQEQIAQTAENLWPGKVDAAIVEWGILD
jgi:hypothetical protein